MNTSSLLSQYKEILLRKNYKPDIMQYNLIVKLHKLQQNLLEYPGVISSSKKGLFNYLFSGLLKKPVYVPKINGIYIWGGVGRGKTWLMDLFFDSLITKRKLRLHFNRFMLRIHQELAYRDKLIDPLLGLADSFKKNIDILCFDEFFVSDIADAILLGSLLQAMFSRGIILIATSNFHPDELYRNGLRRDIFIPAIEQIKSHCDIVNIGSNIDYRLCYSRLANVWYCPLNEATNKAMLNMFNMISGQLYIEPIKLKVNHRIIQTLGAANRVLAIEFAVICGEERSRDDYIEIANCFHSVFLFNLPARICELINQMQRFIMLIDEFYDRHVKLIASAETALSDIYKNEYTNFAYQRCFSKLQEMQSTKYINLPHLPET
ncbi:cell division protein ZapE [Candidatus Ishikawella capsulata]|uniref:Cell division protein ZapE n=1 Tax=Candidatus Ishikawaella capsulata Mpkobe TaxID=476281 RepID=C5WCG8_9ENTR|nr:cell division protein ZapE [Candidatus Ishikawaella capsulata]BAH83024.1 hypothetical protein ICMP_163 [Candidatus Ishikawaella capsulata Mpkobe]